MHTIESLNCLSRKEIQALSKTFNLKANAATSILIDQILHLCTESTGSNKAESTASNEENKSTEFVPDITVSCDMEPEKIETSVNFTAGIGGHGDTTSKLEVGSEIEACINNTWVGAVILKLNKKSVRVKIVQTKDEQTISFNAVRSRTTIDSSVSSSSIINKDEVVAPLETVYDDSDSIQFPANFIKNIKAELECKLIIESNKVPLRKSLLTKQNIPMEIEPVVHPASNEWAMSMESCLHEMVNKKQIFKKNQSTGTSSLIETQQSTSLSAPPQEQPLVQPKRNSRTKSTEAKAEKNTSSIGSSKLSNTTSSLPLSVPNLVSNSTSTTINNNKRKDQDGKATELSAVKRSKLDQESSFSSSSFSSSSSAIKMSASKNSSFKKAPDFSKIHARQFSASKSITTVVERVSNTH